MYVYLEYGRQKKVSQVAAQLVQQAELQFETFQDFI